ncbi:MAG: MFS transporter [Verrucomicrobiales bacterium]|jgi:Na+/melibiose symporter-like transporter|nr:MFS transporter [Verrucomicrobiales bacterium]
MITTGKKVIPWSWVILLTATSGAAMFVETIHGSALTFTIRKFTGDPVLISFIGGINLAFNFLVAPYVSWKSDRVWTKWGRRRPFMLVGFAMLVPSLIAVPYAPSLWILVALIVIYQFALELGYVGPWSPLLYSVVPIHQRGRMAVIKHIFGVLVRVFYNWVLIGQFDAVYNLNLGVGALRMTGEQVIYFTVALVIFAALLNLLFNVRELRPDNIPPPERFNLKRYLSEVFSERQFLMIYLLLFAVVALYAGLGQMLPLLITEQFGYSKEMFGRIFVIATLVDLCVAMPISGLIADRFDRFRTFKIGMILSTLHPLAYWGYCKFIAEGQIPSVTAIVVAQSLATLFHVVASVCLEPYFYDLVPKNKMGTLNSGSLIVRGVMNFLVTVGVGFWVKYYTVLFPCGGKIDYLSGYLYVFLIGACGLVVTFYFGYERSKGRIIEYGRLEEEAAKS